MRSWGWAFQPRGNAPFLRWWLSAFFADIFFFWSVVRARPPTAVCTVYIFSHTLLVIYDPPTSYARNYIVESQDYIVESQDTFNTKNGRELLHKINFEPEMTFSRNVRRRIMVCRRWCARLTHIFLVVDARVTTSKFIAVLCMHAGKASHLVLIIMCAQPAARRLPPHHYAAAEYLAHTLFD